MGRESNASYLSSIYIPKDEIEEGLLLLLLFEDHQQRLKEEDATLIDDLTLGYIQRGGYRHLLMASIPVDINSISV